METMVPPGCAHLRGSRAGGSLSTAPQPKPHPHPRNGHSHRPHRVTVKVGAASAPPVPQNPPWCRPGLAQRGARTSVRSRGAGWGCGQGLRAGTGRGQGRGRRGIFHRPKLPPLPTPPPPAHPPRWRSHMLSGCCHRGDHSGDKETGGGRGVRLPEPPPAPSAGLELMAWGAQAAEGAGGDAWAPTAPGLSRLRQCLRLGPSRLRQPHGAGERGVAPHKEPVLVPGRAAAGTMPAQVTLTSRCLAQPWPAPFTYRLPMPWGSGCPSTAARSAVGVWP